MWATIDGGLACKECIDICAMKGHSNPGYSVLMDWSVT